MSQVKYFSTIEEKFAYPCAAMLYMYPLCHVKSCSIRIMYCYCFLRLPYTTETRCAFTHSSILLYKGQGEE